MKKHILILSFFVGTAVSATAMPVVSGTSQPIRVQADSVTVQQIFDKYIAAIGGKEALQKINDVTMQMSTEMQGTPIMVTRKQKMPNMLSMSINAMGMEVMKQVSDGKQVSVTAQGQTQKLEGKDLEQMLLMSSMYPELTMAEKGVKSTLSGIEKVGGKDAYKVINTTASGITWTDFYDVSSGLKVQTIATAKGPAGETQTTIGYADYKTIDGVQMPMTLNQNMGPMQMKMTVDKVEFNKGLKDSDFEVK